MSRLQDVAFGDMFNKAIKYLNQLRLITELLEKEDKKLYKKAMEIIEDTK